MLNKTPVMPTDVRRYLQGTRVAVGREAFEKWLRDQRERAIHTAIYGGDPEHRSLNAGRAQAFTELLAVFIASE